MAKKLYPELLVESCGKCRQNFAVPIKPYIRQNSAGQYVVGLKCEECGYKKELTLTKGLPMQLDYFDATITAMSQLVTVAFMSNKHIQMTGGGINNE